jgi:ribosome-associated protein
LTAGAMPGAAFIGKGCVAKSKTKFKANVLAAPPQGLELALAAARTAAENRGRDLVVLDLRELTAVFDYFVIATGTSRRQLHAISEEIDRVLQEELGDRRLGIEGYSESRWIVLDYGNVVVHLFDDEARGYYDLENLWAEAKRVDLTATLAGIR